MEREVLKPDVEGRWNARQREIINETGSEAAKQRVREVRQPTITGEWKVVDRQMTFEKSSQDVKEIRSVRQLPDAYGRLADYEVRQERTNTRPGQETREVTVRRRDFQDTHHSKFYLAEHTISESARSGDGKVTLKSKTESDLLAGGVTRNLEPSRPQLVEERFEEETSGEAGKVRTIVNVKQRGVADPRLRPSYQVIQETDREGHVRQLFIPLR